VRPQAHPCDEAGKIAPALLEAAHGLGLVMSTIPEAHGGGGEKLSAVTGALIAEELAWGDLALAVAILSPTTIVIPLLEAGSEAQRGKYLPAFAGERFAPGSNALVEPQFGFNPRKPSTRATREGDGYVLEGTKCFVPVLEGEAPMLVFAREGESVQGFLVRGRPGVTLEAGSGTWGPRASGGGPAFQVPRRPLGSGRPRAPTSGNCSIARARGWLPWPWASGGRPWSTPRTTRRRPPSAFRWINRPSPSCCGDGHRVDAARLLVWEAAWRIDQGSTRHQVTLARRTAADMALRVSDCAVQILGGHGYIREHPVEQQLRNARGFCTLDALTYV
jgi:alkylation response protein AidB-like acyl-CoA dehydrogenase